MPPSQGPALNLVPPFTRPICNAMNPPDGQKKKASRFTGVFRAGKKWKSQVQHNGVQNYLGIYDSEEEASEAYQAYKAKQASSGTSSASSVPNVVTVRNPDKSRMAPAALATSAALPTPPASSQGQGQSKLSFLCPKQHPETRLESLQWDESRYVPCLTSVLSSCPVRTFISLLSLLSSHSSAPVHVEVPTERLEELRLKLRLGELLNANPAFLHSLPVSFSGDSGDKVVAMQIQQILEAML